MAEKSTLNVIYNVLLKIFTFYATEFQFNVTFIVELNKIHF